MIWMILNYIDYNQQDKKCKVPTWSYKNKSPRILKNICMCKNELNRRTLCVFVEYLLGRKPSLVHWTELLMVKNSCKKEQPSMFGLFQTFRPDSRGTSNRASGTRSGVRRWYSRIFKQLSDINIIEGKKIYPVANDPIACKKIISLKNICLFTLGLEQAVSLRTPSLLAAIFQQSLEEVSKSICETSFLPSLNYLDLEVEGIFPRFRWHHSGQRHGWRVF